MATQKDFDKYMVRINGGNEDRVGELLCYNRNLFVGKINFYADGATIPQDYLSHRFPTREYVILQMPMSRFDSVMSTVRVEKPLKLYIDVDRGPGDSTLGHGYLTTLHEPIGEEEGML